MSMRCTVCASPRAPWINTQIEAGRALRPIAREARVSYDAVRRHVNSGHVQSEPAKPAKPADPNASPEELMREVLGMLRSSTPASHADVARAEALRKAAESLSKIAPAPPADTMSVDDFLDANDGLMRKVFEAVFRRLEPHPELREALHEDLIDAGIFPRPDQSDTYYWQTIYPRHHGGAAPVYGNGLVAE